MYRWATAGLVLTLVCVWAQIAWAAPILVLGADGHAHKENDRFLAGALDTPPPTGTRRHDEPAAARAGRAGARAVSSELLRLVRTHRIDDTQYARYRSGLQAGEAAMRSLNGTRRAELEAVLANLESIAAAGMLTPSRLPVLFLTLDRNRSWWTTGPSLAPGQRVGFHDSQLVWEYYPGQGLELQPLGSFGQADWMYEAGPRYFQRLRALVDELIPLAAWRDGGLVWEYYFRFDRGLPPWTSAMSQGTAIQALTQVSEAFHDASYMALAHRALTIFTQRPPVGVAVPTRLGRRYLLYSFAPGAAVLNGFLQSLIGLYDYAQASGDPQGKRLFALGDAEARAEVPRYDTGSWSLYQPGVRSSLDYHRLVTQFLQQLCSRTQARVYCRTAGRFQSYLTARGL